MATKQPTRSRKIFRKTRTFEKSNEEIASSEKYSPIITKHE